MNGFIHWLRSLSQVGPPAAKQSPARSTFVRDMLDVAKEQVDLKIRETSQNLGPGIQKYWSATSYGSRGYLDRQPWCAAFLAWVVKQAAKKRFGESAPFRLPRSAAVNDWPAWAKTQPLWLVLDPKQTRVHAGDIICGDFNGRDNSGGTHIWLAASDERPDGTHDSYEGNTNGEGSRDGNGVYLRRSRTRDKVFAILRHAPVQ